MKIRVFCETENCLVEKETLLAVEKCPNNAEHSVRSNSLTIIPCDPNDECLKDYKRLRAELYQYVATVGFSNLTLAEKKIAATHFVVDKQTRDTIFTLEEQIEHGKNFHFCSTKSREKRFFRGIVELYNRLTYEQIEQLVDETQELVFKYINYGIEGTDAGDEVGLWDYIQAKTGTSYELTGLAAKSWVPIGCTLQSLVGKLMDILMYGEITEI